jgi:hypothetical protein
MYFLYLRKHPELTPTDQAPPHPELRADEGPLPWISQPGKHVGWDAMTVRPELFY